MIFVFRGTLTAYCKWVYEGKNQAQGLCYRVSPVTGLATSANQSIPVAVLETFNTMYWDFGALTHQSVWPQLLHQDVLRIEALLLMQYTSHSRRHLCMRTSASLDQQLSDQEFSKGLRCNTQIIQRKIYACQPRLHWSWIRQAHTLSTYLGHLLR